jgi:hypothetical protein
LDMTKIRDALSELGDFVHPIFHNGGGSMGQKARRRHHKR